MQSGYNTGTQFKLLHESPVISVDQGSGNAGTFCESTKNNQKSKPESI